MLLGELHNYWEQSQLYQVEMMGDLQGDLRNRMSIKEMGKVLEINETTLGNRC